MFSETETETEPSRTATTPTRSASTRQERHRQYRDATRRAILDAALELFVADGYGSVSIRNIAAKVDYSPAAIYSYFASKDEIFFALAEEGFRLLSRKELSEPPSQDPLDDVRAMLWRLYSFSKEQPQHFALVFLDRNVPRISKEYEQFAFMSELRDKTVATMQRAVRAGALPANLDVHVAIRLLFSSVIGLAALRVSSRLGPAEDPDALVRHSIDVTLAGLQVVPPVQGGEPAELPCRKGR